jgi:hypothetical protein
VTSFPPGLDDTGVLDDDEAAVVVVEGSPDPLPPSHAASIATSMHMTAVFRIATP